MANYDNMGRIIDPTPRNSSGERLADILARMQSGSGNIVGLHDLLTARILLSDQLLAVDAALSSDVIAHDDLHADLSPPQPEDFDLPNEIGDDIDYDMENNWNIGIGIAAIFLGIAIFPWLLPIVFSSKWITNTSIISSALIAIVSFSAGRRIYEWAVPSAGARIRFLRARMHYDVLVKARSVLAREKDIRAFENVSGTEFERLVARAFRENGFKVEEVGGANDGGIDLIVSRRGEKAIVQCKAHARPASPAVVRELFGALQHSQTTAAFLVTTNGVSSAAREWARGKPIIILQPDHLIRGF